MVALIRLILRLLKKEQLFLSKYEKDHPHFFWFIGLDALITSVLVIGGLQLAPTVFADSASQHELEASGLKSMSTTEVIMHRPCEGIRGYWFGPRSGAEYTVDCRKHGSFALTYLANGKSDLFEFDKPKLIIQTFATYADLVANRNFGLDFNGFGLADSRGDHVYFADPSEIVELAASHQWVVINYPTLLSRNQMVKAASELILM